MNGNKLPFYSFEKSHLRKRMNCYEGNIETLHAVEANAESIELFVYVLHFRLLTRAR